jgi:hypothetical protein
LREPVNYSTTAQRASFPQRIPASNARSEEKFCNMFYFEIGDDVPGSKEPTRAIAG